MHALKLVVIQGFKSSKELDDCMSNQEEYDGNDDSQPEHFLATALNDPETFFFPGHPHSKNFEVNGLPPNSQASNRATPNELRRMLRANYGPLEFAEQRHHLRCSEEVFVKLFEIFRTAQGLSTDLAELVGINHKFDRQCDQSHPTILISNLLCLLAKEVLHFSKSRKQWKQISFRIKNESEEIHYNTSIRNTLYALLQLCPMFSFGQYLESKGHVGNTGSLDRKVEGDDKTDPKMNRDIDGEVDYGRQSRQNSFKTNRHPGTRNHSPNYHSYSRSGSTFDSENPFQTLKRTNTAYKVRKGTPSVEDLMIRIIVGASEYLTERDKKEILYGGSGRDGLYFP